MHDNGRKKRERLKFRRAAAWFAVSLFIGLNHPVPSAAQTTLSPKETVISFHETLAKLQFDGSRRIRDASERKKLFEMMDLRTMGREALGEDWENANPAQREEFMALLHDLIESLAFRRSSRFFESAEVTYESASEKEPGRAEVETVVSKEGEALDTLLSYHLYRDGRRWRIDDVILDEVSFIEDLRYQFDKIIREEEFEGLLERMREKLKEARSPDAPDAEPPS